MRIYDYLKSLSIKQKKADIGLKFRRCRAVSVRVIPLKRSKPISGKRLSFIWTHLTNRQIREMKFWS
jgi:hypothetical protein